jgi:hypothetical protein
MVSYDISAKKIGEITTIIRPGKGVITATSVYSGDRVIAQTISTRDNAGNVKSETVYGGKVLPSDSNSASTRLRRPRLFAPGRATA